MIQGPRYLFLKKFLFNFREVAMVTPVHGFPASLALSAAASIEN